VCSIYVGKLLGIWNLVQNTFYWIIPFWCIVSLTFYFRVSWTSRFYIYKLKIENQNLILVFFFINISGSTEFVQFLHSMIKALGTLFTLLWQVFMLRSIQVFDE
jgi:hypothetical protein